MIDYAHKAEQAKKQEEADKAYLKAIKDLLNRKRELPLYMVKTLEDEVERLEADV